MSPTLKKLLALSAIVVGFCLGVLLMRSASLSAFIWLFGLVCLTFAIYFWRAPLLAFWRKKTGEWSNDIRQLGLWLSLAFTRNRDAHATATMAHQQHFLQGRIMSPMNLFVIAGAAITLLPLVGGFQEWRINRVKHERDAPCSDMELSRRDNGEFRTTRAACAALGETTESAFQWRTRAIEAEAARIRDIAQIREETELARRAEMARRQRAAESNERQRRRQNESITSALGGPSPDLARSLCELSGATDCSAAGSTAPSGEPAAAGDLPDGAGGAADNPGSSTTR